MIKIHRTQVSYENLPVDESRALSVTHRALEMFSSRLGEPPTVRRVIDRISVQIETNDLDADGAIRQIAEAIHERLIRRFGG